MKWNDITSYSRDNKERKPTCWELHCGKLRIVVTCGHIYHRPEWVMHCAALGMNTLELNKGLTKEQAQAEAVKMVGNKLNALMSDWRDCANDKVERPR